MSLFLAGEPPTATEILGLLLPIAIGLALFGWYRAPARVVLVFVRTREDDVNDPLRGLIVGMARAMVLQLGAALVLFSASGVFGIGSEPAEEFRGELLPQVLAAAGVAVLVFLTVRHLREAARHLRDRRARPE